MWSGLASTSSPLSALPIASMARRGISAFKRTRPPADLGQNTSKRPVCSASTIAAATSSGSWGLTPRVSGSPEPSSVLTTTGMTTLMSTPLSRSSARSDSLRPTTACLVAQ